MTEAEAVRPAHSQRTCRRSWRSVLLVAVLVLTGCGATTELPAATPTEQAVPALPADVPAESVVAVTTLYADFNPSLRQITDRITTRLGDDGAFLAIAHAMERGYDAAQIVAASLADGLDPDGAIHADGIVLDPAGAAAGVIVLPEVPEGEALGLGDEVLDVELASHQARIDGLTLLDAARSAAAVSPFGDEQAEAGKTLVAIIAGLASDGYTLEQIVDALVLGEGRLQEPGIYKWRPADCPASPRCYDRVETCVGLTVAPAGRGLDTPCGRAARGDCDRSADPNPSKPSCHEFVEYREPPSQPTDAGDAPSDDVAAESPTDSPAVGRQTLSGVLDGGALGFDDRPSASGGRGGGYESASFEAVVDGDQVELTVQFEYYSDIRGSNTDAGQNGDQYCGATYARVVYGRGAAGSPTTISLEVQAATLVAYEGALCQDGDGAFLWEAAPGDRGGTFTGQLNGLGIDGEYNGGLAAGKLPIQATP